MEYCITPSLHHSITPSLQRPAASRRAGWPVVAAALLAAALTGCGPASDKAGKSSGTNAATVAARAVAKTNQPAAIRPAVKTDTTSAGARAAAAKASAAQAALRPGAKTNALHALARTGTNAPAAGLKAEISQTISKLQTKGWFYPAVGGVCLCLCLAVVFVVKLLKGKAARAKKAGQPGAVPMMAAKPARKKAGKTTIHSCNVLQIEAQARHLWQFDARGRGYVLNREQTSFPGEPLPARFVAKDWRSLFHHKLNIAWLPPEHVFLRVAQFPASDFDETLSMVELQLEKLSPMPVTQIVWTLHVLPHAEGSLQTVILMIVSRNVVEEFLGQLEGQGYLADRLEMPLLDQLQATTVARNGAWIYPEAPGGRNSALVAWWYGGALQNLALVTLPPANRPESIKEQLLQMTWAGELEGWLSAPPVWHLVADAATAAEWEPALRAGLEQSVEVIAPVPAAGLAALTATRAAQAGSEANLLPAEYTTRYRQQFVDRLWMRGLAAVVVLYLIGVLAYFARLEMEIYRTNAVVEQVAQQGPIYTNAIQLRDRFQVLKDRQELKYAALDCWKKVAELLPDGITLEGYSFSDGRKVNLSGTAPADQVDKLLDFDQNMRKAMINGQLLFDQNGGDHITYRAAASGTVSWSCVLELKRTEVL